MGAWIMAGVTFREATRKKMLWMALAAGAAFLTLYGLGLFYASRDWRRNMPPMGLQVAVNGMSIMGLYAVNFLVVVIAILTSVDTLSGEIASGTIQGVVTKPVSRVQVLLGKWLGFAAMIGLFAAFMMGGVEGITYVVTGVATRHQFRGFGLVLLEALVLLTVTLLFSTTLSTLTSGVIALGLHGLAFIGGWIEEFGVLAKSSKATQVGILASILMPSEALWRRAAYELQSPLALATNFSPFRAVSVPSGLMVLYAGLYMLVALAAAATCFTRRDL